uniref:GIY-YIG nuclease family protein n=1 Tax=Algoriphagus sp. TaxID=1872435 RepID=UPI004047708F
MREGHRFESVILHRAPKHCGALFLSIFLSYLYFIYILFSLKTNTYCIGPTDDLECRLKHHHAGATPSTKSGAPNWEIYYTETVPDRTANQARTRNQKEKKQKLHRVVNTKRKLALAANPPTPHFHLKIK